MHRRVVGGMFCLFMACSVAAQTQEDKPEADTSSTADPAKLQSVTVTAERRAENIKDVPISITTLGGEKLDVLNSGGQDIRFLSGRVPSLNIESSFGRAFPRFYIRGLGNTDFDLNASQPVSLVYDDVVQENPILKGFPVFDLDQIEVLRGPQGTLFGRNSPAGVVKFDSAKPAQKFESYGALTLGSYSSTNVEAALNVPLNQEWATRFSTLYQKRGDWVDNTANGPNASLEGYEDMAARAQLQYAPSKSFNALFNVHVRKLEGSARLFRANIIKPGTNDLVDGFDPEQISIDGLNNQDVDILGSNLRLRVQLGEHTVHSITGYESVNSFSRGDVDGGFGAVFLPTGGGPGLIPFASESADGLPKHRQLTQEFRIESDYKGPTNWQAGLYLFNEKLDIDSFNYDTLAGSTQNGYAIQRQENDAWAVFGSVNHALSDRMKLRGGLRYTEDKKDFSAQRVEPVAPPAGPGTTTDLLTTSPKASDISWDISGTYALNPDVNLYARVAKGFRAPSIQGRLLFGDTISVAQKETVLSTEAGVKAELFDRRARIGLNVFNYTVKDQQLTAVGGSSNFNSLINAEKTIGQGLEVDLQALLADNLLMTLGASYNKTQIKDADLAVQPCGGGCTVTDPTVVVNGTTLALIDGNALPQAPKTVVNFTLRYGILTPNGEWFVYTDWAYRGKINFFLYESKEFTGKSLTEGGVRIGYTWGDGLYEAALFGRNITNQIRVVGGIDFNNLTGFINEPRTWGAQLRASF
jgi:iron complex outermembrane recepter protein